jgi:hypothetical protein
MARAYNALGEVDNSQAQLHQALPLFLGMKDAPIAAAAAAEMTWIMADNYQKQNQADQARSAIKDVLALAPADMTELRREAEALLEAVS